MKSAFMFWVTCLALALTPATGASNLALVEPTNSVRRSRIVVVEEPGAMVRFQPNAAKINAMVSAGITRMTGQTNATLAWKSLFRTNDIIGIKVNSEPGSLSGTRPTVVSAVINALLAAGIPSKQIIIWDRQKSDLDAAGFTGLAYQLGVQVAASASEGFVSDRFYDNPLLGQLVWGDLEFGNRTPAAARKSHLSLVLTNRITRIINIAPLLNHNEAGISGLLYGLALASVDNTLRFGSRAERLATAIPEIIALPEVGDRVALNIMDALLAQYQGEQRGLLHYTTTLNQIWFGTDPVAMDVLGIRELQKQRKGTEQSTRAPSLELYENAALLEIGIADEKRFVIDRVSLAKENSSGSSAHSQ
jgi:hypothetical protein